MSVGKAAVLQVLRAMTLLRYGEGKLAVDLEVRIYIR